VPGARNDVLADQGELKGPLRVHVDPLTTDLIITDRDQHTVRRVIAATGILVRIAGAQDTPGATGDGGLATNALLDQPADAFPDATGGVLIVDRNNHKIRRISPGGTITTVAGAGTPGYTGDNVSGGAAVAQFNSPACVLPIPGGGFYVCDQLNNVIRRVDTCVAGPAPAPGCSAVVAGLPYFQASHCTWALPHEPTELAGPAAGFAPPPHAAASTARISAETRARRRCRVMATHCHARRAAAVPRCSKPTRRAARE